MPNASESYHSGAQLQRRAGHPDSSGSCRSSTQSDHPSDCNNFFAQNSQGSRALCPRPGTVSAHPSHRSRQRALQSIHSPVGGLLKEKVWYSCEGLTWQMTNNYHYWRSLSLSIYPLTSTSNLQLGNTSCTGHTRWSVKKPVKGLMMNSWKARNAPGSVLKRECPFASRNVQETRSLCYSCYNKQRSPNCTESIGHWEASLIQKAHRLSWDYTFCHQLHWSHRFIPWHQVASSSSSPLWSYCSCWWSTQTS